MDYKNVVGQHIKQTRKLLKLKQSEFAPLIGVSVTVVSQWENGSICPEIPKLLQVAQLVDKPLAWFFTEDYDRIQDDEAFIISTYRI